MKITAIPQYRYSSGKSSSTNQFARIIFIDGGELINNITVNGTMCLHVVNHLLYTVKL